jgi:hypothetical protein
MTSEKKKELLYLTIDDAASELDFLFAFARRERVSITFALNGMQQSRDVYIDSIAVGNGDRNHPASKKFSNTWLIEGHFYGDGKSCWSNVFCRSKGVKEDGWGGFKEDFEEITIWGGFQGVYNKGVRKGQISTTNYRKHTFSQIAPRPAS